MASRAQINLIRTLALRRNLDPRAVLSVAGKEGLGGGIGDAGTSFGPFQLHLGGAFPSGIQGNKQAWAWSPAGISYALNRIASVASGLRGRAAVENIISRFERPANPGREIAGALADYGTGASAGIPAGGASIGSVSPLLGSTVAPVPNSLLQAVLNGSSLLPTIRARYAEMPLGGPVMASKPLPYTRGSSTPFQALPGVLRQVAPVELLSEGTGGPTHSTGPHIHIAYTNPQAMLAAIALAKSLGLRVSENPYTGGVDPVHAKNSYHYRTFPGKYNNKSLGEAIDVSGANASRLYALLARGKH